MFSGVVAAVAVVLASALFYLRIALSSVFMIFTYYVSGCVLNTMMTLYKIVGTLLQIMATHLESAMMKFTSTKTSSHHNL